MCFILGGKKPETSYFLKSVSPEANLELGPTDTCQFPQFSPGSHPFTICSASGNILEHRVRMGEVYRPCGVSCDNFGGLSVTQRGIYAAW